MKGITPHNRLKQTVWDSGMNFLNKSQGEEMQNQWNPRFLLTLNCKSHKLKGHSQIKP